MDSKLSYEPYFPCMHKMTVKSRNALLRAEILAIQWAETEISDWMLSSAILKDLSAIATTVLLSLGLPIEQIVQVLSEAYAKPVTLTNTNVTISEELLVYIDQAHSLAREHGMESTETTHILFVFVRDPVSAFSKALTQLNLSRSQVIENLTAQLGD